MEKTCIYFFLFLVFPSSWWVLGRLDDLTNPAEMKGWITLQNPGVGTSNHSLRKVFNV